MKTETLNSEEILNRRPVQLEQLLQGIRKSGDSQIWFDTRGFKSVQDRNGILQRLPRFSYTGAVLYPDNLAAVIEALPTQLRPIVRTETAAEFEFALTLRRESMVILSSSAEILARARKEQLSACLYQYVDDGESLHQAIHLGKAYPFLMICFKDPTNIPLELVIASLQPTATVLIKEVRDVEDVDDAVVSLGVMEVGADGVMYSPQRHDLLESFGRRLASARDEEVALEPATVTRSKPIGMGYRSCIDLATLFTPQEGMVVGSTSQGGVLCCPEVFFLPYMELRPFRVNAGGVHSYVYNSEGRTSYMSELAAGSSVMIVGLDGKTRKAPVGRMKTELRPLRLIEARFESGETINVILQDDWHVRVYSPEGKALNITELKAGDRVLAHKAQPGRHVGIKIDENILEN